MKTIESYNEAILAMIQEYRETEAEGIKDELESVRGFKMSELPKSFVCPAPREIKAIMSEGQGKRIIEHKTVGSIPGIRGTYYEACAYALQDEEERKRYRKSIDEKTKKMQEMMKANSLTEKYKDRVGKPREPKKPTLSPYLQMLQKKATEMSQ